MKTNSSGKRPVLSVMGWRAILSVISLVLCCLAAPTARAGLTLTVDMYYFPNYFVFYTPMDTNALGTAAPLGTYILTSPHQPTNGCWRQMELTTNGFNTVNGGEYGYADVASALFQITNGTWTLMFTNATTTNVYNFTVTQSNITDSLIPPTSILFPAANSTENTNQPTFQWQGPTNWPVMNAIFVYNQDFSFDQYYSLPASQTSWTIPSVIPDGTNTFYINFVTNYVTSLFTASTPLNTNTSAPISGWATATRLETGASEYFAVGTPGLPSSGHTNVAHYTFDDNTLFTADVSGHGNNIGGFGWFSDPPYITNDAVAGPYAAAFVGDCWISPPTNLISTLGQSFSFSLWVKTSEVYGNDTDSGDSGAGIASAWFNYSANDVIPMSLTGNKLAFLTGGAADQTMHSTASINTGNYVHLVVTRDQGTGEKRIYINGVLDSVAQGSTSFLGGASQWKIGFDDASGNGINGIIDDIQLYSGVLSSNEVAYLYNNPGSNVTDVSGLDFNTALNTTGWNWITGGDADWFGETTNSYDGVAAAQSGAISDGQESWIQTTVTGPGTLSFWWQVSSEQDNDFLEFDIDGLFQENISGVGQPWSQRTYPIPSGVHTVKWMYSKDPFCCFDGSDAGYLDEVSFTSGVIPSFTTNPMDQTNRPGYPVGLQAVSTGVPSPSLQWYKVGSATAIPGATNSLFVPTNSGTAGVAGSYYAEASNLTGTAYSRTALVTFVSAPLPPDWSRAFKTAMFNNASDIATNYALACLLDSAGNLYSANSFTGTNVFGSDTLASGSSVFSASLLKQTATGTAIWGRAITNDGHGSSYPQALATAPGNGVYMLGVCSGTNWAGTNQMIDLGGDSTFLARYDANGTPLWVRMFTGTNFNFTSYHCVVADPAGNVTVALLGFNTTSIGATNILKSGQFSILAQFDASGNLRWLQTPSGWFLDLVYSAGRIYGTMFANPTNYVGGFTNTTDRRWALAAMDATTGQGLWIQGVGSALAQGNPIGLIDDSPTVSVSGTNVFLTGTGYGSNALFGAYSVSWPNSRGQYFARYDTNGNAQVATAFGSTTTFPWAAAADASGNVYVGGDFDGDSIFGPNLIAAPQNETLGNGYFGQGFLAKFDRNGNALWARWAQSQTSLVNMRDVITASDGVWACGFFNQIADFGSNVITAGITCIGSPLCTIDYHRSGYLAKITDAVVVSLPVTLLNPLDDGTNFQFSFLSESGFTHPVQYRTNLTQGLWLTYSNVTGDGTLKTIPIPLTVFGASRQGFVRVGTQ